MAAPRASTRSRGAPPAGRMLKTFQAWEPTGFTPGADLSSVTNAIAMEPQAMDWDGTGMLPVTVRRGPPGAKGGAEGPEPGLVAGFGIPAGQFHGTSAGIFLGGTRFPDLFRTSAAPPRRSAPPTNIGIVPHSRLKSRVGRSCSAPAHVGAYFPIAARIPRFHTP